MTLESLETLPLFCSGKILGVRAADLEGHAIFIGHGRRDALLPTDRQRATRDRLRALGHDVTYREYAIPHVVSSAGRRDVAAWIERRIRR